MTGVLLNTLDLSKSCLDVPLVCLLSFTVFFWGLGVFLILAVVTEFGGVTCYIFAI